MKYEIRCRLRVRDYLSLFLELKVEQLFYTVTESILEPIFYCNYYLGCDQHFGT